MDAKQLARRSIEIMATGTLADFEVVVHPAAVDREGKAEARAACGPEEASLSHSRTGCGSATAR